MKLWDRLVVKPGTRAKLSEWDPEKPVEVKDKEAGKEILRGNLTRLAELQEVLYAENKHAVLIVLQAMDAGGKDGAIRRVMSGMNPQGCRVTSFKAPTPEELDHDFLWRIHQAVPRKGEIGVFNRSHYEDVLVVRVHGLVPKSVWSQRYRQINHFEEILAANGVTILKFFLYISKEEQGRRLQERLDRPDKHWKVNPLDGEERKRWGEYMKAYEDAISLCNASTAPWFIIPADRKWFRDLALSQILIDALEGLNMKYPPPSFDVSQIVIE